MTKLFLILVGILIINEGLQYNDIKSFEYIAASRGVMYQVIISKDTTIVKTLDFEKKQSTRKDEWGKLFNEASHIDLKDLDNLKTYSENRYTDKALSARLIVRTKDSTYSSIEFDHGNPPKEIKKIVEILTSHLKLE